MSDTYTEDRYSINVRGSSTPERVPLSQIEDNPFRLREHYPEERISEMAASIKTCGLMQIPTGRREGARVQLAFGMTRLRAFRHLAQSDDNYVLMPITLRDLSDEEMAVLTWEENEAREDCSPIAKARYIVSLRREFGWSQARVAEYLGIGRSTVANKLRLLRLPDHVQEDLRQGRISERQAQAVLSGGEASAELYRSALNGTSSEKLRLTQSKRSGSDMRDRETQRTQDRGGEAQERKVCPHCGGSGKVPVSTDD